MILTNSNINNPHRVGRLGNQMFVIASIIGISKTYSIDYVLPHWSYESMFNVDMNSVNILPNVDKHITESCFGFDQSLMSFVSDNVDTDMVLSIGGYLQDYRYFDEYKPDIVKLFKQSTDVDRGVCSIHVRRGDYVGLPNHHPCCSMDYYMTAMDVIPRGITFKVFSDDIQWCKDNFIGDQYEFIEGNTEVDDLLLMSRCEHNIIANSSFSWWSAYLNTNENKIVIIPNQWFGSSYNDLNTDGLYVIGWLSK